MADLESVLKRLPEDVVEYSVFPLVPDDLPSEHVTEFLEKFTDIVLSHLSDKIVDYIWQHESFNLRPKVSSSDSVPPHLHGSTSFGDNIDDEWFIVYLLYEITREYAGTVVRVSDNDEEFLLIEAANELPKWLNPESAENRVYIYNGDLHVIPIPQTAEESSKYPLFTPSVDEAVTCVRDTACETRCSQAVQNVLNKRLSCFPRRIAENIHHVNCYLPTPLAVLLENQRSLVSAGVRHFYYRDPLELKACRPMKRFKPCDLVRTRVKMTRCLYAQLVQQQFIPDRSSGWSVIAPSNPEYCERDIGMKLAHGFEILCSRYRDVDDASLVEIVLEDSSLRWQQFKKSLTSKGYFRGEIEGSVLYKKLLQEAKQFYQSQIHAGENGIESTGQLVLRHLKHLEPKFDAFRQAERQLPPSDDDSWINVTQQQLDEMMKAAGGLPATDGLEPMNLFKVAESMTAFVEHDSGIEGAEFPKESAEGDGADGQFEGSGLIQAMQKIFEFPDDEDSTGSDMSEYDWSEGSNDELGSPSKMPKAVKKSSLKKSKPKVGSQNGGIPNLKATSKSVRFSTPDSAVPTEPVLSSPEVVTPVATSSQDAASLVNRPTNLIPISHGQSDPSPTKPSNRPTSIPPPVPARPPRQKESFKALNKPSSVVKPSAPPPPPPPPTAEKRDKKLVALMDAMDRELAATDVGKSFEREPKKPKPKRPNRPPPPSRPAKPSPKAAQKNIEDEDDDFQPVNIDLTVVKNTLESYKAQQGLPGPASNILAGFGIKLPQDQVNGKT
ncbi:hypothetical protein BsWGS_20709 [Bradybaena similaris]